jgi:hypothetical protein
MQHTASRMTAGLVQATNFTVGCIDQYQVLAI